MLLAKRTARVYQAAASVGTEGRWACAGNSQSASPNVAAT